MSDVTVVISNTGPQGAAGQGVPVGGTAGQLLRKTSTTNYATEWADPGAGSGSVTSVGLSLPGIFTVSNSPVTTTGTLTAVLAAQQANRVWAGPTTGADAAPSFRALVAADLPNTAVTAGSYTYGSFTVDAQGRLTSAASGTQPVTSVTGTAPIVSSGGTTPALSITAATTAAAGSMSAADKQRIDELGADDSPSFAGLTITGTAAVTIPHIHGDLAGAVYIHVKNTTAGTLAKGAPVYPTGTVGDTTTLEVAGADSSSGSFLPAIGLLADALAPNASGHAVIAGELTGLNTAAYAIGDALYVASGGGMTATRPTTGTIQQVAIVGRVQASTGSVTVTISTELNPAWDTNTGDVTLAASVADVLSLSGQELQADDPGGDRLLFWDDSESRLRHLSLGPGVAIIGTTIYGEYVLGLACSDETSLLTTGTAKISFRMPFPADLFGVRANLTEAPTGSALVVDINEGGVSVLSTKLSIDAGEETSVTAATPAVISDAALADDARITADIDQIGSAVGGAGKGLKLWLYLRRTG